MVDNRVISPSVIDRDEFGFITRRLLCVDVLGVSSTVVMLTVVERGFVLILMVDVALEQYIFNFKSLRMK